MMLRPSLAPAASSARALGATVLLCVALVTAPAVAVEVTAAPIAAMVGLEPIVDTGPMWSSLTARQRAILAPLEEDWPNITAYQKDKWVELAARYPSLSKTEQARIQERMADWSRMSAAERGQARLNFQNATQQSVASDRQARWEAYQALSPEERQRLADRAARNKAPAQRPSTAAALREDPQATRAPANVSLSRTSATKTNIVPNTLHASGTPRAVSASTVQAMPGATTTLVTKRPSPPMHQQTGLPKIAATPGMIDPATLLPQRGAQAAALPLLSRTTARDKDD